MELKENVEEWLRDIQRLLDTCDDGRIIKEGIRTVILGKPNAGKSSLLNVLLGEERAIVTDVEGTTRDVLEEHINLKGISLNIMDTAGIRDTEDIVEKIGVDRAKDYADQADLILYVIDSSRPLDENDCEIMRLIEGKTSVILLNKSDLEALVTVQDVEDMYFTCNPGGCGDKGESSVVDHQSCDNESNPAKNKGILMVDDDRKTEIKEFKIPVIDISAKDMKGIDRLKETLKKLFFEGNLAFNDEIYITNIRHKTALSDAYGALERVRDSIDAGMPEDFYSIDLMDAYEALGNITGETIGEDLVNEIFSKFCMGK